MFPDARRILHAFSGSLTFDQCMEHAPPEGWDKLELVDVQHVPGKTFPTTEASVTEMPFEDGDFDLVLADPPYSKEDAKKYNLDSCVRSNEALREIHRVVAPGGNVAWLDQKLPIWQGDLWQIWGTIMLLRSSNNRVRCVSMFERKP